jgi:uncharacterized protein (TIGR02646 family)
MIQLNSKTLEQSAVVHLASVQQQIDAQSSFNEKVQKAQAAWDSKTSSQAKQAAFKEIKDRLVDMAVGVKVCNYCENNEATDIEHIYPKSFFPERTFQWENYLLACRTCNTDYKLDQFAVFDPVGSDTSVDLIRTQSPSTNDAVLIDPRWENPLDYFWLDIVNRTFILDPRIGLKPRQITKAIYTAKLLGLNSRDTLVQARKTAANYYLDRLERYVWARDAVDFTALEICVQDPDLLDKTLGLTQEKQRVCQQIIANIKSYAHPTVRHELKRQRQYLKKTKRFFEQAPEALTW